MQLNDTQLAQVDAQIKNPVSYKHLTLPTIA